MLDEIVELWNKMTDAGVEHEAHMVHNVGMSSQRCMCVSLCVSVHQHVLLHTHCERSG